MKIKTITIVRGAVIAAAYAALSCLLAPISYGAMQVRVAEALTLLPIFLPEAVPALFLGCAVANLAGGYGVIDIVFGSLCTLLAAVCTYLLRKCNIAVAALPPVLINAFGIAGVLYYAAAAPYWITALWIGLGQIGAVYIIGIPLMLMLKKRLSPLDGAGK